MEEGEELQQHEVQEGGGGRQKFNQRAGRWTVLGPFCSWIASAVLPHNVFRRAWRLAFGQEARDF
eukprot:1801428-Pyramimonas_sp.AAC.1